LKVKDWVLFILLGAIWSASFLWIKIAIREVGPMTLVAFRVLFGMLTGIAVTLWLRVPWPRDRQTLGVLLLLGATSVAIPFFLISWGEQSIDSAVASILNATVPLFTIVFAHLFTRDDRITLPKVLGLLLGFSGVVVLMSRDLGAGAHNSVIGQLAVVLAAVFYAASSVYARLKTQHVNGYVRGAAPLVSASLFMWIAAPLLESPLHIPRLPLTWVALLWLGVLGSGVALILWYYLLHEIGPTRTTMVTYIFPLGGVVLGVIFLDETLSWQLVVGALLIVASLLVVNLQPAPKEALADGQ
jgi:drug/metabolite transporter (DMT)-like permease